MKIHVIYLILLYFLLKITRMLDNNKISHSQIATSQAAPAIKNTPVLESWIETVGLFGADCSILSESKFFRLDHVISKQSNIREKYNP